MISRALTIAAMIQALVLSLAAQTTVFHYRIFDADGDGLPSVPSVGGSNGTAVGNFSNLLSPDIPTFGIPAGGGNRSIVGAGDPNSEGVNSAATRELLNSTVIANGGFTYECWFKWFGGGAVNSVIDYAGTEKIRVPGGSYPLDMRFDTGSGNHILDAAPTSNEWHYVAMVFEHDGGPEVGGKINGTMTWYYDSNVAAGSVAAIKDDFGDSLNRVIGVGRHPLGFGGDHFDGLVYEPRVTLGALSSPQLLFQTGPARDPHLVAPQTLSGASDGNAIPLVIQVENLAGSFQELVLTAPGLSGPDRDDFTVTSFDSPVSANGGTGAVTLDFAPSRGDGTYEAELTINSNDSETPAYEVALTVEVRDPAIVIETELDFGIFAAAPAATADFFLVDNLGGVTPLTLSDPQLSGAGALAYEVTLLPASIAPGETEAIEITFDPPGGGDYPAQLQLTTNDPRNPTVTVDLRAQVRDPEILFDSSLAFGAFGNNPGPQAAAMFIDNFGEGAGLTLSDPQFSGPAAANYSVTILPGSIAPSGSDLLEVGFDPGLAGGSFVAFLTLDTNDPFSPSVTIALSAVVAGPIDLEGPSKISHWTFDDPGNLGDDSGGLDYDGTVRGDAQRSAVAAVGSGALLLDGDSDYIEIPQGAYPYAEIGTDGDGFTIASWVCSSSAPSPFGRQRYFSKLFNTGGGGFGVGQDGEARLIATTYGVFDYFGGTNPIHDEWHHVAYVFRGSAPSAVDYYMDGALVATTNGNVGINPGPGTYAIGGLGGGAGEWFDGLLDDLRIYAVELSDPDIATLAAMATPGTKGGGPSIVIRTVAETAPGRLTISFEGAPDTLHEVRSSADLTFTPFTGPVVIVNDGLTTNDLGNGRGAGFVELDVSGAPELFFQIQQP